MADQLLLDLFDGQPNPLSAPFSHWVTTSKAFLAFAQTYQRKISKKIRMSRDLEETTNLYCELRTAYVLLQESKFAVAYEPYTKEQGRSADLAVTFRTHTTLHVEVTRLRTSRHEQQLFQQESAAGSGAEEPNAFLLRYESRRLADVVCDKFGQLSPDTPNVLWVWSESRMAPALDVGQVMLGLKRSVEQRDAGLYARYGFAKPADFIRYYQRVSAILVHPLHERAPAGSLLWWQNNDARRPLPPKVAVLLLSLIAADSSPPLTPDLVEGASEP